MTVSNTLPNPLRLIGATGSPYTRKMLALLRYRQIPYRILWGDPASVMDQLGVTKPKIAFHPTFLFVDENGQDQAQCDSTPIIRKLEAAQSERSVIPVDPALAFIDYLLEDYGDEWCTKFMFHYRWHFEADADNAGTLLPLAQAPGISEEQLQQAKAFFSERQIGRLGFVGSNQTTAPIIDASYKRLLTLLDRHFTDYRFLLGNRPGSGDFGIFGQLTQLIGFDPTPRAIAHELAPRTVAWVGLTEDLCGLDCRAEDWLDLDQAPASLKDLLSEVGRTYVPALLANANAIAAGEASWETEIDGALWTQQSFPYQAKCLQWIRQEFSQLSPADQQRVQMLLSGTGCEALLIDC